MKRLLVIAFLFTAAISYAAVIPAGDGKVTYIGRTLAENGSVSFDWSGIVTIVRFKGTELKMSCTQEGADWFNVWVDKAPVPAEDSRFKTEEGKQEITICSGLKKGVHEVTIQKRTEGGQGCITIESFETDGQFLETSKPHSRHIEFIGDSYTCGFGTEAASTNEPFRPEEENCNLTYAAIAGRYFDADINLVSHSGLGVVRNYNDGSPESTMVDKYSQVFDNHRQELAWDASAAKDKPDIVVIYLGTNDFSRGKQPTLGKWNEGYRKLIGKVRANYGNDVPVLCVASRINPLMHCYVEAAVNSCGFDNVHWTSIQEDVHNVTSDMGASGHPNYSGHRKVASCVIPYISTVTGWDMPVKPIE